MRSRCAASISGVWFIAAVYALTREIALTEPVVRQRRAATARGPDRRAIATRGSASRIACQLLDRAIGLVHRVELRRQGKPRADGPARGVGHAPGTRAVEQRLPGQRAGRTIVQVHVLHLGDALEEQRVGGIARVELAQQLERARRLLFVPEINQMELVVGLALSSTPRWRACSISCSPFTRSPPGRNSSHRRTFAAAGATSA